MAVFAVFVNLERFCKYFATLFYILCSNCSHLLSPDDESERYCLVFVYLSFSQHGLWWKFSVHVIISIYANWLQCLPRFGSYFVYLEVILGVRNQGPDTL